MGFGPFVEFRKIHSLGLFKSHATRSSRTRLESTGSEKSYRRKTSVKVRRVITWTS